MIRGGDDNDDDAQNDDGDDNYDDDDDNVDDNYDDDDDSVDDEIWVGRWVLSGGLQLHLHQTCNWLALHILHCNPALLLAA